jgi:cell division protein FtsQ
MSPLSAFPHPTTGTWRDIPQVAAPRPSTRTGRRRLFLSTLRFWAIAGLVVASLMGGYIALRTWRDNPAGLAGPAKSVPLREIIARSDGVLDLAWVQRTLAIEKGVGLMTLDLPALRDRLLATGQVHTAVVSRRLPDVLSVVMEERSPVLRVLAQGDDGARAALFVARDGAVFSGEGYEETLTSALPWLEGISLTRDVSGRGFARIDGMVAVSDLLGTVRSAAPAMARSFHSVSLARFARDRLIIVRTPEVAEILFGANAELGYFQQLARLDYILDELRGQASPRPIRSINLSLGGRQVPVAFEAPAPSSSSGRAARPGASATTAADRSAAPRQAPAPYTFFHP